MKQMMFTALAAAAMFSAPAKAAVHLYVFSVEAYVNGTQNVYNPNQTGCNGGPANSIYCNDIGPWSAQIVRNSSLVGETFSGPFSDGYDHAAGGFSGTIVGDYYAGFSGENFTFSYSLVNSPVFQFGTAPTFAVHLLSVDGQAPVPEPATWATVIGGFGLLGAAMRRRRAVAFA